jgi:hypothetical protein
VGLPLWTTGQCRFPMDIHQGIMVILPILGGHQSLVTVCISPPQTEFTFDLSTDICQFITACLINSSVSTDICQFITACLINSSVRSFTDRIHPPSRFSDSHELSEAECDMSKLGHKSGRGGASARLSRETSFQIDV